MPTDGTDLIWAVLLGLIQGITEFVPVSSSAHLLLLPQVFGVEHKLLNSLDYSIALHLGTAIAITAAMAPAWIRLLRSGLGPEVGRSKTRRGDRKVIAAIAVATLVTGGAGVILSEAAGGVLRNPALAGGALLVGGILLFLADRSKRGGANLNFWRLAITGSAQILALIPGVSRSGAIYAVGRYLGMGRAAAIEFAFLLMAPTVVGAALYRLPTLITGDELGGDGIGLLAAGVITATGSGFLVARQLPRYIAGRGVGAFCLYRIVLGAIVMAWLLAG